MIDNCNESGEHGVSAQANITFSLESQLDSYEPYNFSREAHDLFVAER